LFSGSELSKPMVAAELKLSNFSKFWNTEFEILKIFFIFPRQIF
jgi:hypothetical protein